MILYFETFVSGWKSVYQAAYMKDNYRLAFRHQYIENNRHIQHMLNRLKQNLRRSGDGFIDKRS